MPQRVAISVAKNRFARHAVYPSMNDSGHYTHDVKRSDQKVQKPCIDCGVIALKTRCSQCESIRNKIRNSSRAHYRGDYAKRARSVRENAVVCWLCGLGALPGDPWTADHVIAGEPMSDLLPAHRSCNSRRGARG